MIKKIQKNKKIRKILKNQKFQQFEKIFLVTGWALAIFYLSSRSLSEFGIYLDVWEFILRKLAHMFEYGIFTFLLYRWLNHLNPGHFRWNIGWSFVFALLYAISDEYHQTFVPGRHGVYTDVFIDSIGIVIACWVIQSHNRHLSLKVDKKHKV